MPLAWPLYPEQAERLLRPSEVVEENEREVGARGGQGRRRADGRLVCADGLGHAAEQSRRAPPVDVRRRVVRPPPQHGFVRGEGLRVSLELLERETEVEAGLDVVRIETEGAN